MQFMEHVDGRAVVIRVGSFYVLMDNILKWQHQAAFFDADISYFYLGIYI